MRSWVFELPVLDNSIHKDRKGNALVRDSQHQDIDRLFPQFPVGPIHHQHPSCLPNGKQLGDQAGGGERIDLERPEESLDPSILGVLLGPSQ